MSLSTPSQISLDGRGLRIGIVAARYNENLVDALVSNTIQQLEASQAEVPEIERVPGSAELPFAAHTMARSGQFDAVIVIGVVIAGATNHHHVIGDSTALTLQQIGLDTEVPVINGILVVENLAQAEARAGKEINRGQEFALAALEMAVFKTQWKNRNKNQ
jgi:6,7-dimethyl-8-ribityllumazine synthase